MKFIRCLGWASIGMGLAVAVIGAAHSQTAGGTCTGSATAGPDTNGNTLKCNGSIWAVTHTGPGTPVVAAVQTYVATNAGFPANAATFKMPKQIDTTNSYSAATGNFTAPIAGYYAVSFSVSASQSTTTNLNDVGIFINGALNESVYPAVSQNFGVANYWSTWSSSGPLYLNVGDTVSLTKTCCAGSGAINAWRGWFNLYFLHT